MFAFSLHSNHRLKGFRIQEIELWLCGDSSTNRPIRKRRFMTVLRTKGPFVSHNNIFFPLGPGSPRGDGNLTPRLQPIHIDDT